jgi:hypothetical protein
MGVARGYAAGCGTAAAALVIAGNSSGVVATTEEWTGETSVSSPASNITTS